MGDYFVMGLNQLLTSKPRMMVGGELEEERMEVVATHLGLVFAWVEPEEVHE
jgi:hypothetical protein